jgi:uncharacterized repeat protein (TIGR02543 family)
MPVTLSKLFRHAARIVTLLCVVIVIGGGRSLAISPSNEEIALANLLVHSSGQQRASMKYDPILNEVARAKAQDMARRGYFDHVDPDGNGPNYMIEKAGYPLPAWWGDGRDTNYVESIAAGHSSASTTWSDFMGSPLHKRHLLGETDFQRDSTTYGVGYAADMGSKHGCYWVVLTAPPRPLPLLTITSPGAKARVNSPQVTVAGTAGGAGGVKTIQVRLENEAGVVPYLPANGAANWSLTVTGLTPGKNTLRVRSLDGAGKVLAEATWPVWYAVITPLNVTVNGEGRVSKGFLGTTDRELSREYTVVAKPFAGALFAGWTGSRTDASPSITFSMTEGFELTANFVPNPFNARSGEYTGVLLDADMGSASAAGTIALTLSRTGAFSGKLKLGGRTFPIIGQLGLDGTAIVSLARGAVIATIALDVTDASGLAISIQQNGVVLDAQLSRIAKAKGQRSVHAGRYTITLPPAAEPTAAVPQGNGYAVVKVSRFGRATMVGSLADGGAFTQAAAISEDETLGVFVPLYAGEGFVGGSLRFTASSVADIEGSLRWVKPQRAADHFYPAGFVTTLPVAGSRYTPPAPGVPVVNVVRAERNAALSLAEGNLDAPVVTWTTLEPDNRMRVEALPVEQRGEMASIEGLSVRISAESGLFSGKFTHPGSGATHTLRGVIFQKQNAGFGYFLGIDESGSFSLTPAP